MNRSKLIRIGNDINIRWTVKTDGADVSLESKNIEVILHDILGTKCTISWSVSGNVITVIFKGKYQKRLGKYTLILVDNTNGQMHTVDHCYAFELVPFTHLIGGVNSDNVVTEVVELTSTIELASVEVINNLESDDPTAALSAKQGKVLDGKIKERASVSNLVSYLSEGSIMPYADTYIFQIEVGGVKYPVHWNSWVDGETVHQSFCIAHNNGKGAFYIDYLENDEGLEYVASYDSTNVPFIILEAVGYMKPDSTLSKDGYPAEAKATGDALAGKADVFVIRLTESGIDKTFAQIKDAVAAGKVIIGDYYGQTKLQLIPSIDMRVNNQAVVFAYARSGGRMMGTFIINSNGRAEIYDCGVDITGRTTPTTTDKLGSYLPWSDCYVCGDATAGLYVCSSLLVNTDYGKKYILWYEFDGVCPKKVFSYDIRSWGAHCPEQIDSNVVLYCDEVYESSDSANWPTWLRKVFALDVRDKIEEYEQRISALESN